jgi:hypothetical protein
MKTERRISTVRRGMSFAVGAIAVASVAFLIGPSASGKDSDKTAAPFETDVTYSGMLRSGEPELAIDPRDSSHLAITAFEAINTYTLPLTFKQRALAPNSSWCQLQFSDDGGTGWSNAVVTPQLYTEPASSPYHPGRVHNTATDCIIGWAPSGRIYVGSATFAPVEVTSGGFFGILFPLGGVTLTSTTDEGHSFTTPVVPISSEDLPGLLARGLTPSTSGFANPYDRPWLRVDPSNGDVYVAASGHPQYYVTVSHDEGHSWSQLEALDCDEASPPGAQEVCGAYPAITGALIDAARGVLTAAYVASGVNCPCAIFETSTDAGAHWQRHVVANHLPAGSSVQVAANREDKNRFAVSILLGAKNALQVYTTFNSGATWSAPVSLGDMAAPHAVNRPWIAFARDRVAVFWRTAYPPFTPAFLQSGTQNVSVALSMDGGRTFAEPIKINAVASPPPDPTQVAEDDTSFVALGDHAVYAAWGDWRPTVGNPKGDLNTWFGRVPFKHFGDIED